MEALIQKYLLHLKNDLGKSPHTIARYKISLDLFVAYVGEMPITELSEDMLRKYRQYVAGLPVSYKTKNLRLIPIRTFLKKYVERIEGKEIPNLRNLHLFEKANHQDIFTLPSPAEMEQFLQRTKHEQSDLLVHILYETGMRISELLSLKVREIKEEFQVIGKRSKQRTIFCPARIVKWVREYEKNKSPFMRLFPITARRAQYILEDRSDYLGVKVHPHTLRHLFSTINAAKGMNPLVLQDILGHESFDTTRKYINYSSRHLRDEFMRVQKIKVKI